MPDHPEQAVFLCNECGHETPEDEGNSLDGETFCDQCWHDITMVCDDCGQRRWQDDSIWVDSRGASICEGCAHNYSHCDSCSDTFPDEDVVWLEDAQVNWCNSCADEACHCEMCESIVAEGFWVEFRESSYCGRCLFDVIQDARSEHDGGCCEDCYEIIDECDELAGSAQYNRLYRARDRNSNRGRAVMCSDCGSSMRMDRAYLTAEQRREFEANPQEFSLDRYYCQRCRQQDEMGRPCYTVRSYSYRPEPQFKGTALDRYREGLMPKPLYFGVEVEVNTDGVDRMTALADMAEEDTESLFYCKSDSSIGRGFEIVSHPFTFNWMKQRPEAFETLFKLQSTCQAYTRRSCGMHVHMSLNAFSQFHLLKFMRFFFRNPDFIQRVSRREPGRMEEWAQCSLSSRDNEMKIAKKEHVQNARYCALNFQTRRTVEVRIFRSTIARPLFYGNIEFLKGAYDFTKAYGLNDLTVDNFIAHTRKHGEMFKHFLGVLDSMAPSVVIEREDS